MTANETALIAAFTPLLIAAIGGLIAGAVSLRINTNAIKALTREMYSFRQDTLSGMTQLDRRVTDMEHWRIAHEVRTDGSHPTKH